MSSISIVLLLINGFQCVFGQFAGGGGGFGGGFFGFGCGASVPTIGNECYFPETGKGTVICVGKYNVTFLNISCSGKHICLHFQNKIFLDICF